MLASANRLTKEDDFDKIKSEGVLFQSENFGVRVLRRGGNENSRFAFIVSLKIANESVQRNRVKRAMSEAIRHKLHTIKEGYDVIFLAKKQIVKKSTEDIMREVHEFVRKNLEK